MNSPDDPAYVLAVGQDASQRLNFQNNLVKNHMIRAFERAASIKKIKGSTVVDFGCGTSSAYKDIRSFIGPFGHYIGIDIASAQIAFNQSQLKDATYIVGDENTPEAGAAISKADILYMRYVVMHQKNPKAFVQKIYNTAKPGALLIIQEPEDTAEQKAEMVGKYPFCGDLCDLKVTIGKRLGLNYSFAKHLLPILEALDPQNLIHTAAPLYIPIAHAKQLITASLNEIVKNNKSLLTNQEISHYERIIEQLPDEGTWNLDFFHTFIVQKKAH